MKKMNESYEAPKAEMVELNVNKSFMQGGTIGGPSGTESGSVTP